MLVTLSAISIFINLFKTLIILHFQNYPILIKLLNGQIYVKFNYICKGVEIVA